MKKILVLSFAGIILIAGIVAGVSVYLRQNQTILGIAIIIGSALLGAAGFISGLKDTFDLVGTFFGKKEKREKETSTNTSRIKVTGGQNVTIVQNARFIDKELIDNIEEGKDSDAKDFLHLVASLYEKIDYSVTQGNILSGIPIDLIAEKVVKGIGDTRIAIRCDFQKGTMVPDHNVIRFITEINNLRNEHRITNAVMFTNTGFSYQARSLATLSGHVSLMTQEKLINEFYYVQDTYGKFAADYKGRRIFHDYIPLSAIGQETKQQIDDIEKHLMKWIKSDEKWLIAILAEFGTGKTTIVERIKYLLIEEYLSSKSKLKPVLFKLKDFHNTGTLDGLINFTVQREFGNQIPLNIFWDDVSQGEYVFLLDGFDEMSSQVDATRRRDNLLLLAKLITSNSKAILTCRPSYFVTQEEFNSGIRAVLQHARPLKVINVSPESPSGKYRKTRDKYIAQQNIANEIEKYIYTQQVKALGGSQPDIYQGNFEIYFLNSLDQNQIDMYLKGHDSQFIENCGCGWEKVKSFLLQVYDLRDLMKRPILLSMIVDTLESGYIDINNTEMEISPTVLYDIYTSMKLEWEHQKGESRQLLTKQQRQEFAEAIAITMLDRKKLEVSFDEILSVVKVNNEFMQDLEYRLKKVSVEQVASDIQLCTFLSREKDGLFRFSHKSFMEFFAARFMKRIIESETGSAKKNFYISLPPEITYFIGGFANTSQIIWERLNSFLKSKSIPTEYREIFNQNIATAIVSAGGHVKPFKIDDAKVIGVKIVRSTFNHSHIHRVTFKGNKLERVKTDLLDISQTLFEDVEATEWEDTNSVIDIDAVRTILLGCKFTKTNINLNGRESEIIRAAFDNCVANISNGVIIDDSQVDNKSKITLKGTIVRRTTFHDCTLSVHKGFQIREGRFLEGCKISFLGDGEFNNCSFEKMDIETNASRFLDCSFLERVSIRGDITQLTECKIKGITFFGKLQLASCTIDDFYSSENIKVSATECKLQNGTINVITESEFQKCDLKNTELRIRLIDTKEGIIDISESRFEKSTISVYYKETDYSKVYFGENNIRACTIWGLVISQSEIDNLKLCRGIVIRKQDTQNENNGTPKKDIKVKIDINVMNKQLYVISEDVFSSPSNFKKILRGIRDKDKELKLDYADYFISLFEGSQLTE